MNRNSEVHFKRQLRNAYGNLIAFQPQVHPWNLLSTPYLAERSGSDCLGAPCSFSPGAGWHGAVGVSSASLWVAVHTRQPLRLGGKLLALRKIARKMMHGICV